MFDQFIGGTSKPTTQHALGYAQQMMECTLKLTKSQLDVMEGIIDEVSQECRETMASSDPSAILKNWPNLMSVVMRANTEAAAISIKNAKEFQGELFQILPSIAPGLLGRITQGMTTITKTSGSTKQSVRTKKSA